MAGCRPTRVGPNQDRPIPGWPTAGIAFGGDDNPEQWPEEIWDEDVALMRDAGITVVTVAVFAWARLQPAPGEWDDEWLHRIVNLLHRNGIAVYLATATASPPPLVGARPSGDPPGRRARHPVGDRQPADLVSQFADLPGTLTAVVRQLA